MLLLASIITSDDNKMLCFVQSLHKTMPCLCVDLSSSVGDFYFLR